MGYLVLLAMIGIGLRMSNPVSLYRKPRKND